MTYGHHVTFEIQAPGRVMITARTSALVGNKGWVIQILLNAIGRVVVRRKKR